MGPRQAAVLEMLLCNGPMTVVQLTEEHGWGARSSVNSLVARQMCYFVEVLSPAGNLITYAAPTPLGRKTANNTYKVANLGKHRGVVVTDIPTLNSEDICLAAGINTGNIPGPPRRRRLVGRQAQIPSNNANVFSPLSEEERNKLLDRMLDAGYRNTLSAHGKALYDKLFSTINGRVFPHSQMAILEKLMLVESMTAIEMAKATGMQVTYPLESLCYKGLITYNEKFNSYSAVKLEDLTLTSVLSEKQSLERKPAEEETLTKAEAVLKLKPEIEGLRSRGYSVDQIADLLMKNGLKISSGYLRKHIAQPEKKLDKPFTSSDSFIRACVAKDPSTPIEILEKFSTDKESVVRNNVAKNPAWISYKEHTIAETEKQKSAILSSENLDILLSQC